MTSDRRVRVLVVDDHDLFRTGLRALLEEEGFDALDASSGEIGIRQARSFAPDVVVVDMNMPGMSGIEATPLLREAAPAATILMLTIATSDTAVLEAIRAGASGYLLKDAELSELVAGVRDAAAGHSAIAPRVAGALIRSVQTHGDEAAIPVGPELSAREREVLGFVARGCDNAEIADRLYLSASTVKNHVSRILDKLGVDNRVQAATHAIRCGFDGGGWATTRPTDRRSTARSETA